MKMWLYMKINSQSYTKEIHESYAWHFTVVTQFRVF